LARKRVEILDARIVLPLRIRCVFGVGCRDDVLRVAEAGGLDDAAYGRADIVQDE
jgi:hypothetical protein